jgi:DNA-binding CsgD family transcriptional regulator
MQDGQAAAYSLRPKDGAVELERCVGTELRLERIKPVVDALARNNGGQIGLYNPFEPEPLQQNVVLSAEQIRRVTGRPHSPIEDFYSEIGVHGPELRILLCDGGSLLAWFGMFKRPPFTRRDRTLLQAIAPALRKRLILERQLEEHEVLRGGLAAAMEALCAPAFLLHDGGRLLHANSAGRALLDQEPERRLALEDIRKGRTLEEWEVTRLSAADTPRACFVVFRGQNDRVRTRAGAAARRWTLTPRQAEVLTLLVEGRSNYAIAGLLRCSEKTVEQHVTAILARAECPSRARLIALVHEA